MDGRYALENPDRGFFWLESCGALLQVDPYGEVAVVSMCHHIEEPTFDASAVATNSRARCRPIHRPPRCPPTASRHGREMAHSVDLPARCGTLLARFPLRGGRMKDPVCGKEVEAATAAAETQYEGETYCFCSEDCYQEFFALALWD